MTFQIPNSKLQIPNKSNTEFPMAQLNYIEYSLSSPSPLAGEGGGEGEHILPIPTFVLPRQGGE
jgi:hypothetical protein